MNDFSNSVQSLIEGYIKVDAYYYAKKQIDFLLRKYLPLITILIVLIILFRK